ncbi:hypothetical protein P154DRAFT_520390 [Amniculicola lignicola CBS 123094]|uniref:t-SNARE coiled-coil homology domain-containing protein n=1 Tax=Amniculicola lignicola CBS 123094 TaxID=1392246 RepID=A0A6A5WNC8_9PLEO|nr:hypothetical protein P154DRAFT_520390 [Amniculicola lignicola CBS 123094]
MSNRFGRDTSRQSLFSTYDRSASPSKTKPRPAPGYGYSPSATPYSNASDAAAPAFGAYPGASASPYGNGNANGGMNGSGSGSLGVGGGYGGGAPGGGSGLGDSSNPYRSATPNSRGQYSDAVLDAMESQNDEQVSVLSSKVSQLKSLTSLIGEEIRDSTAYAEKMNDTFDSTRLRLKGTMNRMLVMAQKTGVGWKVWLGFFAVVIFLFWYVWLF